MKKKLTKFEKKLIDKILENFDFDKVHQYMVSVDWKWFSVDRVPTVYDLIKESKRLLKEVCKRDAVSISTGGLFVERYCENGETFSLELSFRIDSFYLEKDELDEI